MLARTLLTRHVHRLATVGAEAPLSIDTYREPLPASLALYLKLAHDTYLFEKLGFIPPASTLEWWADPTPGEPDDEQFDPPGSGMS